MIIPVRVELSVLWTEGLANRISSNVLSDICSEQQRAIAKHGVERSAISRTEPDSGKLSILGEEFGEVCSALTYDGNEGDQHLYDELIQVAAVAAAWADAVHQRIIDSRSGAVTSKT